MSILALCIATTGRASVLTETLRQVAQQTLRPDHVWICPAKSCDVDEAALATLPFAVTVVYGPVGLAAQRNTLLRAADRSDIILFIDDDFLLAPDYCRALVSLYQARPDCVIATGRVLADGATGPGYSVTEGRAILSAAVERGSLVTPTYNAYGCNMAIRWSALRGRECWFDEKLPLYAWYEDVDFSRRASAYGTVLKAEAMVGVHLAAKHGRVSGVRVGYSQIANQIYLTRKGSISRRAGFRKACENLAANLIGAVRDNEAWVDRRGRLRGNLYGLIDTIVGRVCPTRILDL